MRKILLPAIFAGIFSSAVYAAPNYTFTAVDYFIRDVNDSGQIIATKPNDTVSGESFILDGSAKTVFSDNFTPISMNNNGHAAGGYFDPQAGFRFDAGYWNGSSEVILGTLGGRNSFAADINNSNQIVGRSATARGVGLYEEHATLWEGEKITDLGTLRNGFKSEAVAINDKGQIVGTSNPGFQPHGVLWDNGKVIDLGQENYPVDINNNGVIVGLSNSHAAVWINNQITDIGTLGGFSQASAINDNGLVVGFSSIPDVGDHAFLWDGDSMVDLNTLLDKSVTDAGWTLLGASHITESGIISGHAHNSVTGEGAGYMLNPISPIPEPSTYAMLAAGLGIMGFVAKRRNSKQ